MPRSLILRCRPGDWANAEWSGASSEREAARAEDACFGFGSGFFDWRIPLEGIDLSKARRLKVLCEASSHRIDFPQTDADILPTTFQILLNDLRVYHAVLRNHPHDSRGVLSYLRGGVGAYGYLATAMIEGDLLKQIITATDRDSLRLRCAVPPAALPVGGLTIYGSECGRFPICPTVIVEW
jgi:predicted transcriptional regulator